MPGLKLLRDVMSKYKLNAFIVPSSDAHMSEYICKADMQREYLTGFTGSNGTAVVTDSKAALWTDGRYYLQASKELNDQWTLMKSGLSDTPSIPKWLLSQLNDGDVIGLEAQKNSVGSYEKWKEELEKDKEKKLILKPVETKLFEQCWPDRPAYPSNPVICHELQYCGKSLIDKVNDLRKEMEKKKTDALVVSALDEIAWLLNIRGSDIDYNPVAISYILLTSSELFWFINEDKISDEVKQHIGNSVTIKEYNQLFPMLKEMKGKKIWIDPASSNLAIYECVPEENRICDHSPVSIPKATKNETEIQGLRNSCLRDSAAIIEYFSWLEKELKEGKNVTEYDGSLKLSGIRSKRQFYKGDSFATISSSGPNAAIIHYHPHENTCSSIDSSKLYLCDSGAQYLDGTTDVTRTIHFGEASDYEKKCFTRVLQGHINLATTIFPKGTESRKLDVIARLPLWEDGLDYAHGTGHGVGYFLNVHEGPTLISSAAGNRGAYFETPFAPGQTVTIEPGYYEDGAFGIRIENDYIVTKADTPHNFQDKEYYTFENLTWVPIQPNLIDKSILTVKQQQWINQYNKTCAEKLLPIIDESAKDYLHRSTIPI